MKTDHLIRALAADQRQDMIPLRSVLAGGFAIGAAVATGLFLWLVRVRPDFGSAVADPLFVHKFLVTLALAFAAGGLLWRLVRPGAENRLWMLALAAAPALLAAGIVYELVRYDPAVWSTRLVGRNAMVCLRTIPLLAAPLLLALLLVMRKGAPTRPALAGAAAGLLAGGIAATLYAAHCTDDSPLFVMTWYGIAVSLVAAAGALIGWRVLRW